MAVTNLKITRVGDFNTPVAIPAATAVGAEGMDIDFSGKDCDILLSVTGGEATVKAGNSIAGTVDLKIPAEKCVVLDSGCFKNVKGPHKGCVFITGASASVSAVELP